jgi:hypothetical protein
MAAALAVEAGAATMHGAIVKEAETSAAKHEIPLDKITAAISEAIAVPDRTAAIVIFALIDDLMIFFLSKYLNPGLRGGLGVLFERDGLLSTAHRRITLSAALYWINSGTYNDLDLLRNIRNRFAHEVSVRSFTDDRVRGYVASLAPGEARLYESEIGANFRPKDTLSPREIYLLRAIKLVGQLCADFVLLPSARANRVAPADLFKDGFETLPENLKNLWREVTKFYYQIAGVAKDAGHSSAQL